MNALTAGLLTPVVDLITGQIIHAGTNGDATKIVARANALLAINTAITDINSGNSAAGMTALGAALSTANLQPGEAIALQNLMSVLSSQLGLLQTVLGSTILGQSQTMILNNVLAAGSAVAQAEIAKYGTPTAAAK
jgi:hypothetical protein